MSSDWASDEFAKLSAEHFEPLCEVLGLGERSLASGRGFAISSAASGAVRVFFEHDRGLCHFSVGLASETDPLCSVEVVARRFPPVRLLRAGEQRLSLSEQTQLIKDHWRELQHMFGPALAEMRDWMASVRAADTAKYSGSV